MIAWLFGEVLITSLLLSARARKVMRSLLSENVNINHSSRIGALIILSLFIVCICRTGAVPGRGTAVTDIIHINRSSFYL